ncbi:hypothetical protein A3860_35915 [Niastella vici]|uniref:Heparan-alpha-glucosaminide N-acetyltransferase catalytic domain-containing protein n=1 Tax=Niastella vici TaxID=1703345 RepID=A0A1V9FNI1_9BACT|nr:heparan-alpha-glucosaminide N-acetyltransferase domain-containing protein [Niastella vici]OQP59900.1 hypothetical protein A3860_35915 [Niastella vici]
MGTLSTAVPVQPVKSKRIHSIDLLRGTVMIIMALDHVRDYFHAGAFQFDPTDLSRTDVPLFFTRLITHFCAPVFTFLAGTSAFLNGTKKTKKELSFFLFTRGLWLVVAEMLIVTLGWSFNPAYPVLILQVIWALGVSMMVLSVLIFLPQTVILITGLAIIAAHNLLDAPPSESTSFLMATLHESHFFFMKPFSVMLGYPVLPWIGIMLTGYGFGRLYLPTFDAGKRRKLLIALGLGAIALFIIIRSINIYGDPRPWSFQKTAVFTFMSFLNTTKYPPSLLYILMTLGPSLLFLAFSEKPLNRFSEKLVIFGRVPMFFYLLHIYLIHTLAVIAVAASGHKWSDMVLTGWVSANEQLKGYGYSLAFVYALWIIIIIAVYPLCRWYDNYKRVNRETWWLSYI